MKIFGDIVMLELLRDEYESDQKVLYTLPSGETGTIFKPDIVKDKEEGPGGERIPFHYFRVVDTGPEVKNVKVGDRVFPKPPDLYHPAALKGIIIWINGKKEARFIIHEADIAGIE